jgi:endonuclease YncB( thermonuclease family)
MMTIRSEPVSEDMLPAGKRAGDGITAPVEASGVGAMRPDEVRALIQAEVDKQEPLDEARRAVALIAESSVRFVEEPGTPGFVIVGADGQRRTTIRDGQTIPFTIAELAAELRRNYPTLFKPDKPVSSTGAPSGAAARDWLMVRSDTSPAAARVQASLSAGLDSVRRGWRGSLAALPWSKRFASPTTGEVSADVAARPEPKAPPPLTSLPIRTGFRPSHALYAGLFLVFGTIVAFLLLGRRPDAPPSSAPAQEATTAPPRAPASTGAAATAGPSTPPTPSTPGALTGVPEVVDTGTLRVEGKVVRLFGVEWARGAQADDLTRYLAGRTVVCTASPNPERYRCQVDGRDLSEVVLYNGGGRATPEATPELKAAESQARTAGLGVWQKP